MRCGGDTPDPEAGRKEPSSRRGANLLPEGGRGGRGVRVPQQRRGRGRTAPPCSARPAVLMSFSSRSRLCKSKPTFLTPAAAEIQIKPARAAGGAAHVGGNAPRAASVNICQEAVCTESAALCDLFIIFLFPSRSELLPPFLTHTHTSLLSRGVQAGRRAPGALPAASPGTPGAAAASACTGSLQWSFRPCPGRELLTFRGGGREMHRQSAFNLSSGGEMRPGARLDVRRGPCMPACLC